MNWFEEWFGSPLYAKLYADRDEDEARQLINFLEQTVDIKKNESILDLGCGRGRHTINLAREGYQVTGVDLSEASIKQAKTRAKKQGLVNVDFQVRDMRNALPRKFDVILNLFTTFGYFADDSENKKVFQSVMQMLKPKGIFILDYLNAHKVRMSFSPSDSGSFQDVNYTIERYIEDGAIHKDIHFKKESTGEKKSYSERVKLYEREWFEREMKHKNLTIDDVFGNYQGDRFEPDKSPRLLIISHLDED